MPTLALADFEVNYQRIGAGEDDVVLVHGLGANLAFWYLGGGRQLANNRQVLLYDLRGHGRSSMPPSGYRLRSMAADLDALMSHVGMERPVHLIGHSFGGRVALAFAGLYPERVRSLIVADTQIRTLQPSMRLRDWPYWPRWREQLMGLGLTEPPSDDSVIDFKLLAELNRYGGDLAGTGRAGPQRRISLRSRDMGDRGRQNWQRMLAQTSASRDFEDEAPLEPSFFSNITAPTLLLFGEYSHCLPTAEALLDLLPRARLLLIPRAGHFFPVVEPMRFARAVNRFLTINERLGERPAPQIDDRREARRRVLRRLVGPDRQQRRV